MVWKQNNETRVFLLFKLTRILRTFALTSLSLLFSIFSNTVTVVGRHCRERETTVCLSKNWLVQTWDSRYSFVFLPVSSKHGNEPGTVVELKEIDMMLCTFLTTVAAKQFEHDRLGAWLRAWHRGSHLRERRIVSLQQLPQTPYMTTQLLHRNLIQRTVWHLPLLLSVSDRMTLSVQLTSSFQSAEYNTFPVFFLFFLFLISTTVNGSSH